MVTAVSLLKAQRALSPAALGGRSGDQVLSANKAQGSRWAELTGYMQLGEPCVHLQSHFQFCRKHSAFFQKRLKTVLSLGSISHTHTILRLWGRHWVRSPACSSLTPCPRWHGQLLRRLPGPGVGPGAHQGRHRLRCGGKRGTVRHRSAPALRYPRWVSAQPLQLGLHGSAVCKCTGPCPTCKDVKRAHFFQEGTHSLIHLCFPI